MRALRAGLYGIVVANQPVTDRQVFYLAVSPGLVDKTENEYKSTVIRQLTRMRRDGTLDHTWIADNTRWMRKPRTYGGLEEMLRTTAQTYRRALWDHSPEYVEVWCEKDTLAGILYDVTEPYDVPLMVTRGYSSITFAWTAADDINDVSRPTTIYYVGDHDPSGHDMERVLERELRSGVEVPLTFIRIAVTPAQIANLALPTRPTKTTDSRSKKWTGGQSVEVDAIPPGILRQLLTDAIESHVDQDQLARLRQTEDEERRQLTDFARRWGTS
jgi:hypothetical protein